MACLCGSEEYYSSKCKECYIPYFEGKVISNIKDNKLIVGDEKIAVAVSGGKDSTVLLYILKKYGYNISAITVDAKIGSYTKENLENIRKFSSELGVHLDVISFQDEFGHSLCYLKSMLNKKGHKFHSCTLCGVLRRYLLNRECRRLEVSKLALGHNMDDEVQNVFMNFFKGNLEHSARLGPLTGLVKDTRFIPRIKPLYYCAEKEVEMYSRLKGFSVHYGNCPCSIISYRNILKSELSQISDSDKQNVLSNFVDVMLPMLKERYKTFEIPAECVKCSEPCIDEMCRVCEIVEMLNEKPELATGEVVLA